MEEDESDDEEDKLGQESAALSSQYDIYVKDAIRSGGFFKQSQSYRMFPLIDARKKWDDYGETINPSIYTIGEFQVVAPGENSDSIDVRFFNFLISVSILHNLE